MYRATALILLMFGAVAGVLWMLNRPPAPVVSHAQPPSAPPVEKSAPLAVSPIAEPTPSTAPVIELDIRNPPEAQEAPPDVAQAIFDALKKQPPALILQEWRNAIATLGAPDSPYDLIKFALADSLRRVGENDAAYQALHQLALALPNENQAVLLRELLRETATPQALRILLDWAAQTDASARPALWQTIADMGNNLWDEQFHPELSPVLEDAWRTAPPDALPYLASALARIGAPQGIDMLLQHSLADNTNAQAARAALVEVRNPAAIPVLQSYFNPANPKQFQLSGNALAAMGDAQATQVLLNWAQTAPDSQNAQAAEWFAQLRDPASIQVAAECLAQCAFTSPAVRNTLAHIVALMPK